jgi:hypothetical protein
MNHLTTSDTEPDGSEKVDGAVEAGVVSKDGKWFWDGSRWSARHATVTGSVVPRLLAWSLMGGLPVGALISLPIGSLLSKMHFAFTAFAVAVVLVAAEAFVVYMILRQTPQIAVERGTLTIGRLLGKGGRRVSVQSITSIELARGSMAVLALTEGWTGEGRVVVHLVDGLSMELGWDAFAGRASTLAWLLGVPLIDPAADASRRRAAITSVQDPGRRRRQRILITAGAFLFVLVVLVLLFGPVVTSIFEMVTHRL